MRPQRRHLGTQFIILPPVIIAFKNGDEFTPGSREDRADIAHKAQVGALRDHGKSSGMRRL